MATVPTLEEIDLDDYGEEFQGAPVGGSPFEPLRSRSRPRRYKKAEFDAADQEFITRMAQPQEAREPVVNIVTGDRGRIDRALSLAATMDIPFREAYDGEPTLTPMVEQKDPGFFSTAGESFMRGIGNMYVLGGRALSLTGATDQGEVYRSFGQRIQRAYMPKQRPEEFTWSRMVDPSWYATTVAESVPVTLSLIPAAVVGAYGFGAAGAAVGLGAFGKAVLATIGGAAFSRSVEAGFEAAGTYEDAIRRGMSEEEAQNAAATTFKGNLALTGVDAAQFALAFTPLRMFGSGVPKILQNRALAAAVRFGGVAAIEAGEEATQEAIQQYSLGDPIGLTPQMKESAAIGALFGVGIGGAGSVFRGIVDRVESRMSPTMAEGYQAAKQQAINQGVEETQATVQALDQIAGEPGGQEFIAGAMKELKDIADGKEVEPFSQEDMQGEIEKIDPEQFSLGDEVQAEPEILSEETIDSILKRETSVEEIFNLPAEEAEVAETKLPEGEAAGEQAETGLSEALPDFMAEFERERMATIKAALKKQDTGEALTDEEQSLLDLYKPHEMRMEEIRWELHTDDIKSALKKQAAGQELNSLERRVLERASEPPPFERASRRRTSRAVRLQQVAQEQEAILTDARMVLEDESASNELKEAARAALEGREKSFIVSEESYRNALSSLKGKTGGLHAGVDPTVLKDFVIIGTYHIERGIRSFAEWSKVMIERFGDAIKPHLRDVWKQANDYLAAKQPARDVKRQIRLTTGQERIAKVIREDVALSAALKKAEQAARIAYRVGTKEATERATADFRDVLIAAKVKAEQFGFREGFKVSEKLTRKELLSAFKDQQKDAEETRKALRDVIQEELPIEERGKFLDALVARLTKKKQSQILDRVIDLKERLTKKELIEELGEIQHYKGEIPVEYQRRLQEIVGDINTKNFTPATVQRIKALKDYSDQHGMPSGVSANMLAKVEVLSQKQAVDMTVEELREVVDLGKHLLAMGKLKQKLKHKYNARVRQAALNKLLASTHNLDFKASERDSAVGTISKGAQHLYLETLTPIRVAEMIDGFKSGGANGALAKHIALADKNAQWAIRMTIDSAMQEMADTGIADLTPEQQIRIMINIRFREGAQEAVENLMNRYGILEFPKLDAKEEKLIGILQKYMTAHVDEIAALYEETQTTPFVRQPNYILPLKYEGEARISPEEAIIHTPFRKTQTQRGFTNVRKRGVQKIPRVDVLGVFEEGVNEQLWYLYMQPAIDDVRQLVKAREYVNKAGEMAAGWWKDHLDIVARRGWSAKADHNPFSQMLRLARGNITKAMLGYKLSSILMQPFAVFDAVAYAQSQYGTAASREVLKEFAKSWVVPGYAAAYIEGSKAAQLRRGGEVAIEETLQKIGKSRKWVDRFVKGGLSMLQKADVRTAAAAQKAFETILEEQGIPQAKEEAAILMDLTSSSSDVSFRPHILARGEGARTWFTFQTFMLNRWGMIAHDLVAKGLIKGDLKTKISAAVGLGIIVAAKLAEDEAREYLYRVILRRNPPDRSALTDALYAIPSNVPVFGGIYETVSRRTSEIPLVKIVTDLMRAPTIPLMDKPEAKARAALRAVEATAVLTTGVPGTAQAFDIIEGVLFPEKESTRPKPAVKPQMAKAG